MSEKTYEEKIELARASLKKMIEKSKKNGGSENFLSKILDKKKLENDNTNVEESSTSTEETK